MSAGGGAGRELKSDGTEASTATTATETASTLPALSHLSWRPDMERLRGERPGSLPRPVWLSWPAPPSPVGWRRFVMSRHYELVLMLDPVADDNARDKLADDVRKRIEKDGTLELADSWGMRKMAYEIRQRNEADYRYYRFEAENELLEHLDHNLKIADGALRFRIFKVDPDAPTNPPPTTERPAHVGDGRGDRDDRERRPRRDRDDR